MDLLLLQDENAHHYVLILNLERFVAYFKGIAHRAAQRLCRNCFHLCTNRETYQNHVKTCSEHAAAEIVSPKESNTSLQFGNWKARWFLPIVLYFDTESYLVPIATTQLSPSTSYTVAIEKHEPCGYAIAAIEHGKATHVYFELKRGDNCMNEFVKSLHVFSRNIYNRKRAFYGPYRGPVPARENNTRCWICENEINDEAELVLDHCPYDGHFLGWAHQLCNTRCRTFNFTPMIGHSIEEYDMHDICLAIAECEPETKFEVIPSTDENYISLSVGQNFESEAGQQVPIFEYIRLIDSFNFMPQSLESLVADLPDNRFEILRSKYESYSNSDFQLLCQKPFYCYSYITSEQVFEEKVLRPLSEWKNTLHGGEVTISKSDYNHAQTVFSKFGCQNIGGYHDLNLTCNTLILACVFEAFRDICCDKYGLDCAQYYGAPNLSGDAFLKVCKPDLHLLTEREKLELVENTMRGGVSSINEQRHFQANNCNLPNYDGSKPSTYALMLDANNLYGGVMQKDHLPLKDFALYAHITFEEVLKNSSTAQLGYIIKVDIDYPPEFHEAHQDYPLAPSKLKIKHSWLSGYQKNLILQMHLPEKSSGPKLVQTLLPKNRYTLHYRLAQFYNSMGLKFTKLHRALKFEQANWMRPYMELNTSLQIAASTAFGKKFYNGMNNSAFGKTCESKMNRDQVVIVRNAQNVLQRTQNFHFKSFKIFGEREHGCDENC